MAQPLKYNDWVAQKYVQTEETKDGYAALMVINAVKTGAAITTAGVQSWRANVPADYDNIAKKTGYSKYLADFPVPARDYLTFTCVSAGTISLYNYNSNAPSIQYSKNNGSWTNWNYSAISLAAGDVLKFKGTNANGISTSSKYSQFIMTGKMEGSGNVMSLIDGEKNGTKVIPCSYCFYQLFMNCTALISAPEIPATTLKSNCYNSMFYGCTSLTESPILYDAPIVSYCYSSMFSGTTSLTKVHTNSSNIASHITSISCSYNDGSGLISGMESSKPVYLNGDFYANSYYKTKCFAEGTNINLADGSFKKVEDINYDDELLVWDFDNACYASAKPLWIAEVEESDYYFECKFSDGTILKLVGPKSISHRVFSIDKGMFEYPQYCVGDKVFTKNGICVLESVKEIDEHVRYYNLITDYHMNLFAENVLTSCRYSNIYPVEDMKYVKDDRKVVPFEEFEKESISKEYYDGLRLGEQPLKMEAMKEYVNKLVNSKK